MICSQPIQDDEMAISEGMCYGNLHHSHSSCMKEYLAYPTAEKKCRFADCFRDFSFDNMFAKRSSGCEMVHHHYNATQFVHSQDKFTSTATISRPLDTIISTHGEGKDYPELFKIENGALVDETLAD